MTSKKPSKLKQEVKETNNRRFQHTKLLEISFSFTFLKIEEENNSSKNN